MLVPAVAKSDPPTNDDRCTPPEVLGCVSAFWPRRDGRRCDFDPTSNPWSLVNAAVQMTKSDDSLAKHWDQYLPIGGSLWLNPPFSNPEPFIHRAIEVVRSLHAELLVLVRHDSTTAWWELIERHADALCLVRSRVRFRLAGEDTGAADHATTIAMVTRLQSPHRPRMARGARLSAFRRSFDPLGLVCEVRR